MCKEIRENKYSSNGEDKVINAYIKSTSDVQSELF